MKIKMIELFQKAMDMEIKSKGAMRSGQCLMNALASIDSELYDEITNNNLTLQSIDPFYDDRIVEKFLNYLDEVWD